MSEQSGPVYEVTLKVAREAATDLDGWLAVHVEEMLELPGFIAADISALDDDPGSVARVVCYYMESAAALDNYFNGPASVMRARTADKFGEHLAATRRVLHPRGASATAKQHCLNCTAILSGQYCGNCGQRAQSRLISVWELLRDAFGDLFDVDSRLWQTLLQLGIRPGHLTRDYLRGRRARYLPPFRTYLVLSLLFFVIAFFNPRQEFSLLFEPVEESAPTASVDEPDGQREAPQQQQERAPIEIGNKEVLDELRAEGIELSPGDAQGGKAQIRLNIDGEDLDADCDLEDYDPAELPAWLGRRLSRERLSVMCQRIFSADGEGIRSILNKLLEYVPAGLFVLLPLMALVLKVLYPLSKRYYVEHLLLVVHYHAFVFLALIVQVLLTRTANLLAVPAAIMSVALLAVPLYIPVYLYKSLRRVYEQGHWLTSFKFSLLFVAYWAGLTGMLLVMAAVAAFSA